MKDAQSFWIKPDGLKDLECYKYVQVQKANGEIEFRFSLLINLYIEHCHLVQDGEKAISAGKMMTRPDGIRKLEGGSHTLKLPATDDLDKLCEATGRKSLGTL